MNDQIETPGDEVSEKLSDIGAKGKPPDAEWIYVAIPNMGSLNTALFKRLFDIAENKRYRIMFNSLAQSRFHDHARNQIVEDFLRVPEKPQWLLFIDADCIPTRNVLSLADLDKDIAVGMVIAWLEGKIVPSLFQRAECEQCRVAKIWLKDKKNNDPEQYLERDGALLRWNPFNQQWSPFISADGSKEQCRCMGTGFDPWVYRTIELDPNTPVRRIDAAGMATALIKRKVLETIQPPAFQFLFKPNRKILFTEDLYFCWRASLHNFSVWCDLRVAASHMKEIDLLQMFMVKNKAFAQGYELGSGQVEKKTVQAPGIIIPIR